MMKTTQSTAAIILAAGESHRLGRPKQALRFAGQSLLERTATVALESQIDNVIVVLGAEYSLCKSLLRTLPVTIALNKDWRDGISSSIKTGLRALRSIGLKDRKRIFGAALFLTCDQPFISPDLLDALITGVDESTSIVASEYSGRLGIPALFARKHFAELLQLEGDCGARNIIADNIALVTAIPFPQGAIDIDTTADAFWVEALNAQ